MYINDHAREGILQKGGGGGRIWGVYDSPRARVSCLAGRTLGLNFESQPIASTRRDAQIA